MAKFRLIIDSADSPASLTQSCTLVRLLVAAATQHVGVCMCSIERQLPGFLQLEEGNIMNVGTCGFGWSWGGVGRGACWEREEPLILPLIYITCSS